MNSDTGPSALVDLALAGAAILLAVVLVVGSSSLPPPRYEPMGSAALPQILAGLIVLFAGWIGAGAVRRRKAGGNEMPSMPGLQSRYKGIAVFATLIVYVLALDVFRASFVPATTLFVTISAHLLSKPDWRKALAFFAFGLLLSSLIFFALTRFFYVDLG